MALPPALDVLLAVAAAPCAAAAGAAPGPATVAVRDGRDRRLSLVVAEDDEDLELRDVFAWCGSRPPSRRRRPCPAAADCSALSDFSEDRSTTSLTLSRLRIRTIIRATQLNASRCSR